MYPFCMAGNLPHAAMAPLGERMRVPSLVELKKPRAFLLPYK